MLNKGSLISIAFNIRKKANKQLLILYFVLRVIRKKAKNNEMNKETMFTITNKLILSILYSYLFIAVLFLNFHWNPEGLSELKIQQMQI